MGPKGYPGSVLFYIAIAVTFLALGRVALRSWALREPELPSLEIHGAPKSHHPARTSFQFRVSQQN